MIEAWKPERIIYVSCNPVTLSRDLSLFAEYKPVLAKVFDGYYGSEHVETVVYLSDADKRNEFDIERFLSRRLKPKPDEVYDVYDIDASVMDAGETAGG